MRGARSGEISCTVSFRARREDHCCVCVRQLGSVETQSIFSDAALAAHHSRNLSGAITISSSTRASSPAAWRRYKAAKIWLRRASMEAATYAEVPLLSEAMASRRETEA